MQQYPTCGKCHGRMYVDDDSRGTLDRGPWAGESGGLSLCCLSCGRVVWLTRERGHLVPAPVEAPIADGVIRRPGNVGPRPRKQYTYRDVRAS